MRASDKTGEEKNADFQPINSYISNDSYNVRDKFAE